jgi:hypothetical protein
MGKSASTYVAGLENIYDVTSGNGCKCDCVVRWNISPLQTILKTVVCTVCYFLCAHHIVFQNNRNDLKTVPFFRLQVKRHINCLLRWIR